MYVHLIVTFLACFDCVKNINVGGFGVSDDSSRKDMLTKKFFKQNREGKREDKSFDRKCPCPWTFATSEMLSMRQRKGDKPPVPVNALALPTLQTAIQERCYAVEIGKKE